MSKLRIGMVGLGGIAQKAYLPILSQAAEWQLVGGFSPNQQKAQTVCDSYRMRCFSRLDALAEQCDAVFVHSSTASHFAVVQQLLQQGVHVYVDKPLAETVAQGEQLIELAQARGKTLMVGFNRRFAPLYRQLKQQMQQPTSLRMDKHRSDSVGPQDMRFTLLDDYLHVVDTALWLGGEQAVLQSGHLQATAAGEMLYAEHHFQCGEMLITTSMHRRAGSQRESVQAVTDGACYQLHDMRQWLREDARGIVEQPVPGWQSTLAQRGFDGAVRHFIEAVGNQSVPETAGEQGIRAQRVIERLLRDAAA
ncbi:Gfo/Idh/MocA family protein [Serratia odorifera]|jgi:virulence factor|uniref:Oxidoreductase, NAD-binding domain protein n=2 Tax=Serratia odorifera TaxID=618 RepID=D4E5F9_SEROD|nr:Gfo/Idh/MocA family oxidoreductase [Serratia odorifera]EFE94975.1 oxidoreductase, NAD-binding domain protein [Serratia odorifera DSM 4582]MBJ2064307.1 Gfo/Idh/MocA family oxidoreductase [Serratia odorifera]PNK89726.1 gfo/Idh/MocA family oxidoreductase [Serratia odorifera]RII70690.1 gfo/Idh/MocA family oxidoreductase [Serratia odorifera]VDZ62325.1 Virulence factor mviM homolog [Serratia odorifera]